MSRTSALILAGALVAAALAALFPLWARLRRSERERIRATDELNRRLSELFSLQELSFVLSDSIQLDRIVEQVARYAMRFLGARGSLLALTGENLSAPITVAATEGTLAPLAGLVVARNEPGLIARSVGRDRLELVRQSGGTPTTLVGEFRAEAAAAVPLRAHGVVVGTLVIVEPRGGHFASEDLRLLSTVATHTAVVIANARFFDLVRRAKEQWETAFDALSEGMAVVDDQGRVRRANRALAQMLGRGVDTVIGDHLGHALLGRSEALDELLAAARRGDRPPPLVTRSSTGDRTVRVNAARMPSPTPEQSLVVLVEDVTEQHALESQLIQSEKLAAVGQLVSGVAHELNNPLTSIAGLSEFLLEQKEFGENDRGHLRVIHEQADRAGKIVRNLLTFARKAPTERERVDLNDVVERTTLLMSYDPKLQSVATERSLAPLLPELLGDRHALQQVVLNLVANAAQAVADNPPERPRAIRLETWFDGQIHLRVSDTGHGISDEVARQLFTPFFTTKEPGQGTGLGLSITYAIIAAHAGRIEVERPSVGAAFRIDLPPAPADLPATARAASPAARRPPKQPVQRTILLVDDDPAVRRVVQALFGREGHTVEVARNAEHALELAGKGSYDLIIADARETGAGRLFVEELVERRPQFKARMLVATGDVRPSTEETVLRLGLRYVRKPFNLRDLREEAARAWASAES
ncbi:MAG TPA: ATP-binding protein [Gemmatimonadales bacterium]|nr:ATP-binding protein [Gemmatimonadales bacterium]